MNQKAVDNIISQIRKNFGDGSIMKLGQNERISTKTVSTGSMSLDMAIGITNNIEGVEIFGGGLPLGRIVEIYGPESSGKTTLALHAIAEGQKSGGTCAFIDVEHALDPVYAEKLGVNTKDLIISQPASGEEAMEIVNMLVNSEECKVLVLDSVAALVPQAELDGEMGDVHMGSQARLMSQALRKLTRSISRSSCLVIFINQIRQKIGVFFGNPETTTGGNALKFYASVRMDVRKIETLKDKDIVIGSRTRVKVVKNKLAPPFTTAEFDIMYGEGISRPGEIIDLGVKFNIIEKSGSWFSFEKNKLGQGKETAKNFLQQNPDIAKNIENQIRSAANPIKG